MESQKWEENEENEENFKKMGKTIDSFEQESMVDTGHLSSRNEVLLRHGQNYKTIKDWIW